MDKHGFDPNTYESWRTGGNNVAIQLGVDAKQGDFENKVDGKNGLEVPKHCR